MRRRGRRCSSGKHCMQSKVKVNEMTKVNMLLLAESVLVQNWSASVDGQRISPLEQGLGRGSGKTMKLLQN